MDGGDMMRYAEYVPKDKVKSDAEIDRGLVGFCFHSWIFSGVMLSQKCYFNPDVRLCNGVWDIFTQQTANAFFRLANVKKLFRLSCHIIDGLRYK